MLLRLPLPSSWALLLLVSQKDSGVRPGSSGARWWWVTPSTRRLL
jgi:hypothetical protein